MSVSKLWQIVLSQKRFKVQRDQSFDYIQVANCVAPVRPLDGLAAINGTFSFSVTTELRKNHIPIQKPIPSGFLGFLQGFSVVFFINLRTRRLFGYNLLNPSSGSLQMHHVTLFVPMTAGLRKTQHWLQKLMPLWIFRYSLGVFWVFLYFSGLFYGNWTIKSNLMEILSQLCLFVYPFLKVFPIFLFCI